MAVIGWQARLGAQAAHWPGLLLASNHPPRERFSPSGFWALDSLSPLFVIPLGPQRCRDPSSGCRQNAAAWEPIFSRRFRSGMQAGGQESL